MELKDIKQPIQVTLESGILTENYKTELKGNMNSTTCLVKLFFMEVWVNDSESYNVYRCRTNK